MGETLADERHQQLEKVGEQTRRRLERENRKRS
jgi:hypothetical protein